MFVMKFVSVPDIVEVMGEKVFESVVSSSGHQVCNRLFSEEVFDGLKATRKKLIDKKKDLLIEGMHSAVELERRCMTEALEGFFRVTDQLKRLKKMYGIENDFRSNNVVPAEILESVKWCLQLMRQRGFPFYCKMSIDRVIANVERVSSNMGLKYCECKDGAVAVDGESRKHCTYSSMIPVKTEIRRLRGEVLGLMEEVCPQLMVLSIVFQLMLIVFFFFFFVIFLRRIDSLMSE